MFLLLYGQEVIERPAPGDTAAERQGPGTVSTEPAGLYR